MTTILALLIIVTADGSEHAHLMLAHQCRQDVLLIKAMADDLATDSYLDVDGEKIISMECRPFRMGPVA